MLQNIPQPYLYNLPNSEFQFLYINATDSGGFTYKDIINQVVKRTGLKQKYNHAHEWCCGHGVMGFTLLDQGTCDKLTLSDIDYTCIMGCQFTVAVNNIADKVDAFLIEEFSDIPVPNQPWDLIITNPPYVPTIEYYSESRRHLSSRELDMWIDPDWVAHKNFFSNIKKYIDSECDIYMFGETYFIGEQIELAESNGFKFIQKYNDLKVPGAEQVELLHFRPE